MWCSLTCVSAACQDYQSEQNHSYCQTLPYLYAGACSSTGAMYTGAYHIAHGQGTCTLAKQQSVALSFSLASPATLRCHNKGAAHVIAANVTHRMQCPAAVGLQPRQVEVRAVMQPDIGSERDPLAGEQCLLVCESSVYLCVRALSTCVCERAFPCLQQRQLCFMAVSGILSCLGVTRACSLLLLFCCT